MVWLWDANRVVDFEVCNRINIHTSLGAHLPNINLLRRTPSLHRTGFLNTSLESSQPGASFDIIFVIYTSMVANQLWLKSLLLMVVRILDIYASSPRFPALPGFFLRWTNLFILLSGLRHDTYMAFCWSSISSVATATPSTRHSLEASILVSLSDKN